MNKAIYNKKSGLFEAFDKEDVATPITLAGTFTMSLSYDRIGSSGLDMGQLGFIAMTESIVRSPATIPSEAM